MKGKQELCLLPTGGEGGELLWSNPLFKMSRQSDISLILCKLALKSEVINYEKHMAYRQKYEVMLSELSEKELNRLFIMYEHEMETHRFQVLGYDIEVKDALIAEALQTLTEKKRNVVLLSYFMDMSDADIAREMNLVRSTINEHRRRSLELMRKNMEESANEKK